MPWASGRINEVYPDAKYQRCTVHFYRNVLSVTPRSKVRDMAAMLKAIHAQENKAAAKEKARAVRGKAAGNETKRGSKEGGGQH